MFTDIIGEYISSVEEKLMSRFENRERLLQISREVIRFSGETISLSHRGKKEEAMEKYNQAKKRVEEIKNIVQNFPELLFGDVGVAFQEISEASVVLSFYFDLPLNLPKDLGIPDIYYITGLADAIGEMRRAALESLRRGDKERGRRILEEMENLYDILWRLEYPKSLVPGLRQKVDAMRKILEDTRHDVFLAEVVGKVDQD